MATPPKIPTAKGFFGFASRPLADYFQAPAGAAFDTSYSPTARRTLLENDLYQRDQRDLERGLNAETEADAILDEAAGLTDDEIEARVLRNPRLMDTPQFGLIEKFTINRRQFQEPNPKSDIVLGPVFAEKITDPDLKAKFQERMGQGISAADAWNQYTKEDFNRKQAVQLAEAGIPEAEFPALQQRGLFDPVAVARRVSEEKVKQAQLRSSTSPLDQQIELLRDATRTRMAFLEKSGLDPVTDPELNEYNAELGALVRSRLGELKGAAPAVPAAAPVAAPVPGGPVPPVTAMPVVAPTPLADAPTPEEARQVFEARKQEEEAVASIDKEWTQAKLNLGSKLLEKYPNRDEEYGNPAVLLASSILNGKTAKVQKPIGRAGNTVEELVPYTIYALQQIGARPDEVAFQEPGNARWGSQKVSNQEVLEAWAKDFLTAKGLLADPNAAPVVAPQNELQAQADEIAKKYQSAR